MICPKCGQRVRSSTQDGEPQCLFDGWVLYPPPLPMIKAGSAGAHTPGSGYDRLDGVRPTLKGPGSLAR